MRNKLSGKQLEELGDALLAAFPTWSELAQMFNVVFGEPMQNRVAERGPLRTIVFDLIAWVQSERRLDQLLDGALDQNPGSPQLRAAVEVLRRDATERPAVTGAVALGELTEGGDLDRCVYVAALVYDVVAFKARVEEHVQRVSRRPEIATMPGRAAVQLRTNGYLPAIMRGPIADSFGELVGQANDLRVFAVIATVSARTTWPQQRTRFLTGLLGERFRKRNHGITRLLAIRERVPDTVAAVRNALERLGVGTAAPLVFAETPATDALCGICDGLAGIVHRACAGEAPIPRAVRGKIVHIYDHVTKRNYSLADAFP